MSLRKSAQVLTWSDAEVAAFIQRIVTEGEFALSENSHKLRTYSNSFAGLDFVSFLNAKRLANSRAAAVTLGRDWLARGFIQHVTLDQQFQDAPHIYRFHNYGRPEAIDEEDFVAIESKSSAAASPPPPAPASSARTRLVPPASASDALLPPSGPLPKPTSFEVNQLGVLVADSLASVSLYNQLTPDSQLLSDCNCSPEHSGTALLAMPVVGRSTYVLPRSKLSDGTRNVEIEHLDVLVGDDINDDEDLHGEDEDASNSDVYVDDDDDDDNDGGGGAGGVGAGINSSEGFSLANSVKQFATNSKARAKNVGGAATAAAAAAAAADDDDDDTGPTRKYEPPKSALIALINSVSDTVARNDSFDNRVGELRENDITYLSKFQEDSPVASKILLSSRKLPPAKPTAGAATATGAMRLRLPYSEQAPPNAGLLREAPAQYQAIPEAKRPPALPAKLQRRDFAEFEATALRELFARSAVPSAVWRRCAPTTIVVLCPTCCEPMAVRPRPRVSSRALPFSAKTLECGGCKCQIMPPLLPPPSCDECRLRRPATRVCIPDQDVSVMWLCRRCCARVERLLSAVVEDLPTLADNSVGTFSGSGAQHAVFRAETVTEILLTRAIDPPGWHRKMISRPSMRQDTTRTSNSAKK